MAIYYVATNGVNAPGGGTIGSPWATGQYAADRTAPGDTVYFRGGTYYQEFNITISGTSGSPITYASYPGETAIFDGQAGVNGVNSGLPWGTFGDCVEWDAQNNCINWQQCTPADAPAGYQRRCFHYNGMIDINASWVIIDGLVVKRSMGTGIRAWNYNNPITDITIQNCVIDTTRNSPVYIVNGTNRVRIENCTISGGGDFAPFPRSAYWINHPAGGITFYSTNTAWVENCTIHNGWGEMILADSNDGGANDVYFRDNIFYDNYAALGLHAVSGAVIERNYWYWSKQDRARQRNISLPPSADGYGKGPTDWIVVTPAEHEWMGNIESENVAIRNNIITGGWRNIDVRNGPTYCVQYDAQGNCIEWVRRANHNVLIANNTIVNAYPGQALINFSDDDRTGFRIHNNLFFENDGADLVWNSGFLPSDEVTYSNNAWSRQPSVMYDAATDVIISGTPFQPNWSDRPDAGTGDPNWFRLVSGSNVIGEGKTLDQASGEQFYFNTDYLGATRSAPWDIGAFEYDGVAGPNVSASAIPTSGEVPLQVAFTCTVNSGSPNQFSWTFGDGGISSSQNPTYTYQNTGTYTARVTATDTSTGLSGTSTVQINVQAESSGGSGGTGNVIVEQVTFAAGASSFSVSDTPKAILFIATNTPTNNTVVADATMSYGVWANGQQRSLTMWDDDNVGTTSASTQQFSSGAIQMRTAIGTQYTGTVSSVTSSQVNLSWSGTNPTGQVTALVFSGAGVTNATVGHIRLGTQNSTSYKVAGTYNLVFAPTNLRYADANVGNVEYSFGIAVKNQAQYTAYYSSRTGQDTSDITGGIFNNRLAKQNISNGSGSVELQFGTSDITFIPREKDIFEDIIYLALNVSEADAAMYIGTVSLNSTSHNIGFEPQHAMMVYGNYTNTDTINTTGSAGSFGIYLTDGDVTHRTHTYFAQDSIGTTNTGALTDDELVQFNDVGTIVGRGSATATASGLSMSFSDVPDSAATTILFAVESASTPADAPTADFDWQPKDGTYEDTIQFTDLSSANDPATVAEWSWDFGDTASATTENPTHQYADLGEYSVTLVVTDSNDLDSDPITKTVVITAPPPFASFTYSPSSGTLPLDVTMDASGTDPGGTEPVTYYWEITNSDGPFNTTDPENPIYTGTIYTASGVNPTVTIEESGDWDIMLRVTQDRTNQVSEDIRLRAVSAGVEIPVVEYSSSGQQTAPATWTFTDTTTIPAGHTVQEYRWSIAGATLYGKEVNYYFDNGGTYTVDHWVTTNQGEYQGTTSYVAIASADRALVNQTIPGTISQTSVNSIVFLEDSEWHHFHSVDYTTTGEVEKILATGTYGESGVSFFGINENPPTSGTTVEYITGWTRYTTPDATNRAGLKSSNGTSLVIDSTPDDIILRANAVLPDSDISTDLGSVTKRWKSLYAAELKVHTLVSQENIGVIGNRVLIGPGTTNLSRDINASVTLIYTLHNFLSVNDIVYMEKAGQIEYMRITNGPITQSDGSYQYTVTRNLDGTGANSWANGDAIFSTGTTGSGWFDIYAIDDMYNRSLLDDPTERTQTGPTIAINKRKSNTFNDWTTVAAFGSLDGLYGYSTSANTIGAAFGDFENSKASIVIEPTSGIRFVGPTNTGLMREMMQFTDDIYITSYQTPAESRNTQIWWRDHNDYIIGKYSTSSDTSAGSPYNINGSLTIYSPVEDSGSTYNSLLSIGASGTNSGAAQLFGSDGTYDAALQVLGNSDGAQVKIDANLIDIRAANTGDSGPSNILLDRGRFAFKPLSFGDLADDFVVDGYYGPAELYLSPGGNFVIRSWDDSTNAWKYFYINVRGTSGTWSYSASAPS